MSIVIAPDGGIKKTDIASDLLKAAVLNTVYEMDHVQALGGFSLLAAKHLKTNVGIIVVNGNFGRAHFKLAIEEGKKAGLNTRRMYVYAETATYSGKSICFTKLFDIGVDSREFQAPAGESASNAYCDSAVSLSDLYAKWGQLSDVTIDEEGAIDEPFLHFSKGTPREEIWAWFERRNPKFVVAELQRGIRRSDEEAVASEGGPDGRTHELYIKIAADSIATLRKVDVFRVIESVRPDNIDGVSRASLSLWISAQRPDLSEEVADVLQELAN